MEPYITLGWFALVPFFLIMALHWAFKEYEIQAPWTYIIGVAVFQLPLILWMLGTKQDPLCVIAVVVMTVVTGIGDLLAYVVDALKALRRYRKYGKDQRID